MRASCGIFLVIACGKNVISPHNALIDIQKTRLVVVRVIVLRNISILSCYRDGRRGAFAAHLLTVGKNI